MAIFKDKAGQKLGVFAYDAATGAAKTGDAANITAYLSKDYGTPVATDDTNPTELHGTNAPGWYVFDLTKAETNAEALALAAKSSTAGVLIDPVQVFTADSTVATAAALSTVDGNILALPGVADIADGLWDELLAGHAIAGSAGEALAQAAVPYCIPGNPVAGGPGDIPRLDLRGVQGDTTQWAITGLDLTGATTVWITAKDALWKDDAHAVFQVSDDAGLAVLAEQVAAHPEWGVLTIIDADSIAVMLDENATRVVPGNVKLLLDIQKQTAGGITTIAIGTVEFRKDVTWTI